MIPMTIRRGGMGWDEDITLITLGAIHVRKVRIFRRAFRIPYALFSYGSVGTSLTSFSGSCYYVLPKQTQLSANQIKPY